MRILIVDDEKDMEILFRQKFRREVKANYLELIFAFSGDEALKILQKTNPPSVGYVFSDINMPGMTGFDLLKEIKSQYPEIYVSMISAYADGENYNKAINSGAKKFFTKPINFDSLKNEINQLRN